MKAKIPWPIKLTLFVCLGMSGLGIAQSDPIKISNSSFEDPPQNLGSFTSGDIPGWKINTSDSGGCGVQHFTTLQFKSVDPLPAPADGAQALYIFGDNVVYQDVGALAPNTTYTLTVAVGCRLDQPGGGRVELVKGTGSDGAVVATSEESIPHQGTFEKRKISYTTGDSVAGDLIIVLARTTGDQVIVDNVKLTATPSSKASTWIFCPIGTIVLGFGVLASKNGGKYSPNCLDDIRSRDQFISRTGLSLLFGLRVLRALERVRSALGDSSMIRA